MSVSSEVRRTLVKSPPELWAELSDPAALTKHLGELGEIRVVRTEPERIVEWESSEANGRVEIEPSGWGTKVTLTATRQVPELVATPEPVVAVAPAAEAEPEPQPEPVAEAEAETTIGAPIAQAPETAAEVEPEPEPEPNALEPPKPEPQPRRGFFARLFGRRHREEAVEVEPEPPEVAAGVAPEHAVEPEPTLEPPAAPAPELTHEAPEAPDLSAELAAAEEVAAEQVTAVLTSVLDRLGAAHHRPFSRA